MVDTVAPATAEPAPLLGDRRVVIVILGALMTVSPFAIDLYLPSLPLVAADLHATTARVSLSLSSYFVGMAFGQLVYGPLLDRFGRKPPIAIGMIAFIATSFACPLAPGVEALIALRLVQALGGCVAQVGAMAMVRDFFPPERGARVFSLLMLILGVSPLLAPTVGGLIAGAAGWRWIFVLLGVLVSIILAATLVVLPAARPADRGVSLRPGPIVRRYLHVLSQGSFAVYAFSSAVSFSALFVFLAASPGVFMDGFGLSARAFGGVFAIMTAGFIGGNQLNLLLLRRWSGRVIIVAALLCELFAAAVFLVAALTGMLGPASVVVLFFATLAAQGLINPNAAALALARSADHAGTAASLLGFIQIGVAASISSIVGAFDAHGLVPIAALLAAAPTVALMVVMLGRERTSTTAV